MKFGIIAFVLLLVVQLFIGCASAKTIIVDDDPRTADYMSIQHDVNATNITFIPPTPEDGAEIKVNYVNVTVKVTDPDGVGKAILYFEGKGWVIMTPIGEDIYYSNVTNLSNGVYTYRVWAFGLSDGETCSEIRTVIVNVTTSKSIVMISIDKFIKYSPADTMTIAIDISNPTEESVTFQWFWGVPQFSVCVPVMTNPIPAGYDDTLDFSFTIPDWGSTPFGNVFYVHLLDASGEVLDADAACWAYSPGGEAIPAAEVDITKEIRKTIEMIE